MLIGGAITGGIEMISQLSQVSWNFRCLNWGEIGFAAGAGAVGGMLGFTGAALGVSIAGSGLMGALLAGSMGGLASGIGMRTVQTAVSGNWDYWQNDIFNPGQMAADLAFGAVGGGVGYGFTKLAPWFKSLFQKKYPKLIIDSNKMPNIADNIRNAQQSGAPTVLTRTENINLIRSNRASACRGFCGLGSPDEYPFASTYEGGKGAFVRGVPLYEQNTQGGILSQFYRKYNILDGDKFKVIVR